MKSKNLSEQICKITKKCVDENLKNERLIWMQYAPNVGCLSIFFFDNERKIHVRNDFINNGKLEYDEIMNWLDNAIDLDMISREYIELKKEENVND